MKPALKLIRKLGYKINENTPSLSVLSFVLSIHTLVKKIEISEFSELDLEADRDLALSALYDMEFFQNEPESNFFQYMEQTLI